MTRQIKKNPFVLLYFACQEKSLGINANHSLFKKSQLKCFFFSSDKEVISKVDKTITRKANLHTLSSIIVQSADSEGLTFDSSFHGDSEFFLCPTLVTRWEKTSFSIIMILALTLTEYTRCIFIFIFVTLQPSTKFRQSGSS